MNVKHTVTYTVPKKRVKMNRALVKYWLVYLQGKTNEYPRDLLKARREKLLKAYQGLSPEAQKNVIEELAELDIEIQKE